MPNSSPLITFVPATLSKGKVWFVYYYVINPATEKLVRKRHKLDRISSIRERQKFANKLINEINQRLYSGWNPFVESAAPKGYEKLCEVLEIFYRAKTRELRPDSLRSYRSFIDTFQSWLISNDNENLFAVQFNKRNALEYMDYLYIQKKVSNTTLNNYLRFNRLVFTWMIERQYCVKNHFNDIRKKRGETKQRIIIPEGIRKKIKDYLESTDYDYFIVCLLVFHALIRPKEIANLKRMNFSIENQTIFVNGTYAKNKKDRVITIPDALMPYLKRWNFNLADQEQYIFSDGFNPGKKPIDARRFSKKWTDLRKEMDLPMNMKLYSLRDSGIVQMLNDGISPAEIMNQADHSSLEITTRYAKFANPNGSEQIKKKGSGF